MTEESQRDHAFPQLSLVHARLLLALHDQPRIGQETLSRSVGVAARTVLRALSVLERDGYLTVHREHKPYCYVVRLPDPEIAVLRQRVAREDIKDGQGVALRRTERARTCHSSRSSRTMSFEWFWALLFASRDRSLSTE
jgi:hypothetical protein